MSPAKHAFTVSLFTPEKVLFSGQAEHVIFPGERGTFEILQHHKPLVSRLVVGKIFVDGRPFAIQRGIVKVGLDKTTAIVEEVIKRKKGGLIG